jgi:hypothetical protein
LVGSAEAELFLEGTGRFGHLVLFEVFLDGLTWGERIVILYAEMRWWWC